MDTLNKILSQIPPDGFVGNFEAKIDDKNRFKMPVQFLKTFDELYGHEGRTLYCCPSLDKSINIFPRSEWHAHMQELKENIRGPWDRRAREVAKAVQGSTHRIEIDNQGRLKLSPPLIKLLDRQKEITICGLGAKMEIWAAKKWAEYTASAWDNIMETQDMLHEESRQSSKAASDSSSVKPN
jgi:MraZ protein